MMDIIKQPPLNSLAKELFELQAMVKNYQVRIEEIKEQFRCKGTFATQDFVVSVKEIKRELVGPNDLVMRTIGRDKLDQMGLIYDSNYLIVSVTRKGPLPSKS